jgi:hypothetical protein
MKYIPLGTNPLRIFKKKKGKEEPEIESLIWQLNAMTVDDPGYAAGIRDKVIKLLKEKMAAGVYEPSQSSYRSKWFCVAKKNGKLRIVHDLQPLNKNPRC